MGKENEPQGIPKEFNLKDRIKCPACGAEIEVDLDIDVSFISDLAKSFKGIGEPPKEDGKE